MPTKFVVTLLMCIILSASTPIQALATEVAGPALTPGQLQKIEQIEATLESENNHPLRRIWEVFSRTTVTGFLVDRIWNLFQMYSEARQYREETDRKERFEFGKQPITPRPTTPKTFEGREVTPTAPTPSPVKQNAPGGTQSVPTKGGATPTQTIPTGSEKQVPDDEIKKKGSSAGAAVITAFTDGIGGAVSWLRSLFAN